MTKIILFVVAVTLLGCTTSREITPTEFRGLAMLHQMGRTPDEGCCCD